MLDSIGLDSSKIINYYRYGSVVYNTNTELSDNDYIIVYEQECDETETLTININNKTINIVLYSKEYFQKKLDKHHIDSLECFFLNKKYKKETYIFNFNMDLDKLRRSISAVCSNSFVKTKKKILQGDDYIGKKSLFHSLRIADLGIQIAKYNKIIDYTKPYSETLKYNNFKELLDEIMIFNTWLELKNKYQEIANNLRTEFRKLAPLKEE